MGWSTQAQLASSVGLMDRLQSGSRGIGVSDQYSVGVYL